MNRSEYTLSSHLYLQQTTPPDWAVAVMARTPRAPAAPRAACPTRPRNPRREVLTLVASFSASRPIFANMMDLLQVKTKLERASSDSPLGAPDCSRTACSLLSARAPSRM